MPLADPQADPGAASHGGSLSNHVRHLDEQIAGSIRQRLRALQEELSAHIQQSTTSLRERLAALEAALPDQLVANEDLLPVAEQARAEGRSGAFADLQAALVAVDHAEGQREILAALLEQAGRFASRTALFLLRPGQAQGWGAYGFAATEHPVSDLAVVSEPGSAWEKLGEGRSAVSLSQNDIASLASQLGVELAQEAVLIPLVLADRVAAALYADRLAEAPGLEVPALQALSYAAAQAVELEPLRERAATPTLALDLATDGAEALPMGLWSEPAASEAEIAAAPPEPQPSAWPEAGTAQLPPEIVEAAAEREEVVETWTVEPAVEPAAPAEAAELAMPAWPLAAQEPVVAEPASAAEPEPAVLEPRVSEPAPFAAAFDQPFDEVASPSTPAVTEPEPVAEVAPSPWSWQPPAPLEVAPEPPAAELLGEVEPPAPPFEPVVPTGAETLAPLSFEPQLEEPPAPVEEPPATVEQPAVGFYAEPAEMVAPFAAAPTPVLPELPPEVLPPEVLPPGGMPPEELLEVPPVAAPQLPQLPDVDVSEDATVLLKRPTLAPPSAAPTAIEPEDETHPRLGAATRAMPRGGVGEVRPPSGFEGPGLAFAGGGRTAAAAGGETAAHEEARRLARLLVSEIRLYNEEQVEEGRRNRDIYPRLRDEIDRSRKMYEERIAAEVRTARDYFQEELVRRLADGDPTALGM